MIPLWITAPRPPQSRWGWALRSVGCPWVAHRVCPIPLTPPSAVSGPRAPPRAFSFPPLRRTREEDGERLLAAGIADDPTHRVRLPSRDGRRRARAPIVAAELPSPAR